MVVVEFICLLLCSTETLNSFRFLFLFMQMQMKIGAQFLRRYYCFGIQRFSTNPHKLKCWWRFNKCRATIHISVFRKFKFHSNQRLTQGEQEERNEKLPNMFNAKCVPSSSACKCDSGYYVRADGNYFKWNHQKQTKTFVANVKSNCTFSKIENADDGGGCGKKLGNSCSFIHYSLLLLFIGLNFKTHGFDLIM